jgi:5'-3' exonuclease
MGIPTYFRHLTRKVKGLLANTAPTKAEWLCFDFNCLIYHVLQRPPFSSAASGGGDAWETHLLDEVVKYTMKVVRAVGPTRGVYLAVDGVVPMAKIKQQRMRRFHGAGASSTESISGAEQATAEPRFSRNAITPGTIFMSRLGDRLKRMKKEHTDIHWTLSLADETGEGEHKVLAFLRGLEKPENIVVYGLDADLIVLSMLAVLEKDIRNITLFREIVEKGEIERDAHGEEVFHYFSVSCLAQHLGSRGFVRDYCIAMMLLGNDFLPTAMTFRIKEAGHEEMCTMIQGIRASRRVAPGEATPVDILVKGLIRELAEDEEGRFYKACSRKLSAPPSAEEPDGPLTWRGEAVFFEPVPSSRRNENRLNLRADWRDIYYRTCLGDVERARLVAEYWKGMRWVVDYYNGRPVSLQWVYAWHYPPLWADLAGGEWPSAESVGPAEGEAPITPTEQLALVLPVQSWGLLPRGCHQSALPLLAPEWFPIEFGLTHIGRRWLWECEPEIPIPTVGQMRARLAAAAPQGA